MHKFHWHSLLAVVVGMGGLIVLAPVAHAASYETPQFPTEKYQFNEISWIIENLGTNTTSLEWQTSDTADSTDSWSTLPSSECREKDQLTRCYVTAPTDWQGFGKLRLQYPDGATLKSFNLNLEKPTGETIASEPQAVYYSAIKTLNPEDHFASISWRETTLTPAATDQIIVQTRFTSDHKTWSPWQGNFNTASLALTEISELTSAEIKLASTPTTNQLLQLTYQDTEHPFQPTSLIGAGENETDAFANRQFTLADLGELQVGQNLIIAEEINGEIVQAQAMIADLQPATNQVTTYPFYGIIPNQGNERCDGRDFCFTTNAQVYIIQDIVLPLTENVAVWENQLDHDHILTASLITPTTPTCLEADDTGTTACRTWTLPLTSTNDSPQAIQYRLFQGPNFDRLVKEIYLLPNTVSTPSASDSASLTTNSIPSAPSTPIHSRLRGGRNLTTIGRPTSWN